MILFGHILEQSHNYRDNQKITEISTGMDLSRIPKGARMDGPLMFTK